jgi:hypothetical protein
METITSMISPTFAFLVENVMLLDVVLFIWAWRLPKTKAAIERANSLSFIFQMQKNTIKGILQ